MNEVISISDEKVMIGSEDGTAKEYPVSSLNYQGVRVGDKVKVYEKVKVDENEATVVIAKVKTEGLVNAVENVSGAVNFVNAKETKINKHLFVWVGAWLLGVFGVDRFMRGQVGVGICKLLFGWMTLGIWAFVDWIIALIKVYGGAYSNTEDVSFINGKYSK